MIGDLSLPAHTHTHSITGIPRSRVCPHGPFSALSRHTSTRIFRGFAATPCLASGDVEDLSHGKSPWDALAARTSLPPPLSIPPSAAQDSAQKITPSAAIISDYWLLSSRRELQSDYWPKRTLETGGHDA